MQTNASLIPEATSTSTAVDAASLRRTAGQFVTGVTVVTTITDEDAPRGFTANSFTSVSLDPPLVLVCIGRQVGSYTIFERTNAFAINVLAADQTAASAVFASKRDDKFEQVAWTPSSALGNPLLTGTTAWIDCEVRNRIELGDHLVLVGHVRAVGGTGAAPLAYSAGQYASVVPLQPAIA